MVIINLYKFLYYKFYSWQVHWFGKDEEPGLKSLIFISVLLSLNVYSVLLAVTAWTKFDAFENFQVDKIKLGILYLVILGLNYLFLMADDRHEKIVKRFNNERKFNERLKLALIFLYVVFSVLSPFLLM